MDVQITYFFALLQQVVHRLPGAARHGTHTDDYIFRIVRAIVVKWLIIPPCQTADFFHISGDNIRQLVVIQIAGLTALEIGIRILSRGPKHRVFRVQCILSEFFQFIPVHQLSQIFIIETVHLLDLMGGSESVEKM